MTVAVANDGSDEEACEHGIARAKDFARQFADVPPQCSPLSSGAVLQFGDRDLSDAPQASPNRPRLRDRQGSPGYAVYSGEWEVDSIYQTCGGPDSLRWFWLLTVNGPMTRADRVATLEEAQA
jgi:hypothetical protein